MVTKNIQPEVDVLTFTPSFSSFMEREIFNLSTNKRLGTAKNYRSAKKSLHDFFNKDEILFSELTPQQISEYERWLEKKELSRNTISFYMRILRSVYNKAVEQQLASENFPFYNVYTGIDRTRKRAIDVNIIKQLQNLDLTKSLALLMPETFLSSASILGEWPLLIWPSSKKERSGKEDFNISGIKPAKQ